MSKLPREFRSMHREPWRTAEWISIAVIVCMGAVILAEVW